MRGLKFFDCVLSQFTEPTICRQAKLRLYLGHIRSTIPNLNRRAFQSQANMKVVVMPGDKLT